MAAEQKSVGVGLVGLGVVGTGLAKVFADHGADIDARLGFPVRLVHVADIDLKRDRGVDLSAVERSTDWKQVVANPAVDIVVELIGGTGVARDVVLGALAAGKSVVTANK